MTVSAVHSVVDAERDRFAINREFYLLIVPKLSPFYPGVPIKVTDDHQNVSFSTNLRDRCHFVDRDRRCAVRFETGVVSVSTDFDVDTRK